MTNASNGYAGDMTPTEAWDMLQSSPDAQLVDVRSMPEWSFVGVPELASLGKEPALLAWRIYPHMDLNPVFVEECKTLAGDADTPLLFLCRTGARSKEAAIAMTQAGYTHCYNILNGFEGDLNPDGKRGNLTGWKAEQLPWRQN